MFGFFHLVDWLPHKPESYLGRKTIMTDIANEIGLGNDLITNTTGQSYIGCLINGYI
jgi:hypothetical protein